MLYGRPQQDHRPAHDLSRTPRKQQERFSRSPLKSRRDCSPCSRSPISRKQKRPTVTANEYYPQYIPLGRDAYNGRDRTPLKERTYGNDNYNRQARSPQKALLSRRDQPIAQRPTDQFYHGGAKQPKVFDDLKLFSRLANNLRKDAGYPREDPTAQLEMRFQAIQERFIREDKVARDNTHNLYRLDNHREKPAAELLKKPTGLLLKRHQSNKQPERTKPKTMLGESLAHLDKVLASDSEDQAELREPLSMDPYL